jgi:phosphoribosylaminoimidazolecarboxamide formyltransferase / IMP cyclohydrolase
MNLRQIRRALLSVSDKTGLVDLASSLSKHGVEMISTGGTHRALVEAGLPAREVADVTGWPEMLGGRVKTVHPILLGGILALRDDPEHAAALEKHAIPPIDLVVCNLYPFEATVARPGCSPEQAIENIDIGGPTLVRAAAKNYQDVAVLSDPAQYAPFLHELDEHEGSIGLARRERLAAEAFARVAAYDQAVNNWFAGRVQAESIFPPILELRRVRRLTLRYGENPHQQAAFYLDPSARRACVARADVLHGKELSYNNLLDLDSALALVREFERPAAVVIKHNNPCGAAEADCLADAFAAAYAGDPLSSFGGVLAFNRPIDAATATIITEPERFIECMVAPSYDHEAFTILTTRPRWKKSVRLLRTGPLDDEGAPALTLREIEGGLLVQTRDRQRAFEDFANARTVTRRAVTPQELADLHFAWPVVKHVKSNAIVLAHNGQVVGVGAGQMSRVDAVHLAVRKAGERARGAVLASDAFFPFRDNIDAAAQAGVTAIVQPGGSLRDTESIVACDEHGLAMILTGTRHFRH